ncbi:pectin lyase-like protein [Dendrothele bispora CBS 962.96]|uniref:endo-polygalacturonase n=1 Tax=Dendrothele bispora (strain CBS 962.96) TaxID=1314807 RepID=A0A4S8MKV5_DENBC|nr:pectin lyase-like protein [Dendrothele bispora CBS 962.96]
MKSLASLVPLALASASFAAPFSSGSTITRRYPQKIAKRCTGTISSLADVEAAQECDTVVINSFTVDAGETFTLNPADGATVTMTGDVTFGFQEWEGPLMVVEGNDITFDGGGFTLNGQGEQYWDGQGGNGGVTKPAPLLRINHDGGSFSNVVVLNSPARAVAIGGDGITVSKITVDNSAGDEPNSRSDGDPAGANTDGFDISANSVTVEDSVVMNQDDCLAINRGDDITFQNNQCSGGHGISVGSIDSDTVVSNVQITGNTVSNSMQCFRIKTDATATDSSVSGVTYTDNTAEGCDEFGVLITQSYPEALGTPGTGVIVSDITFAGTNTVSVNSDADRVDINCGSTTSCPGTWDFSGLTVTGGSAGTVKNVDVSGGSF